MVPTVLRETTRTGRTRTPAGANIRTSLGWLWERKDLSSATSSSRDFDVPARPSGDIPIRKPQGAAGPRRGIVAKTRRIARQVLGDDSSDDSSDDDDDDDGDGDPESAISPAPPLSRPSSLPSSPSPPLASSSLPLSLSLAAPTSSALSRTVPSVIGTTTVSIETSTPSAVDPSSSAVDLPSSAAELPVSAVEPSSPAAEPTAATPAPSASGTEPSSSSSSSPTAPRSFVLSTTITPETNVPPPPIIISTINVPSSTTAPRLPVFSTVTPETNVRSSLSTTQSSPAVFKANPTSETSEPSLSVSSDGQASTAIPVEQGGQETMDIGTQRALIAAASIGIFISVGFVVWLIWRTILRVRNKRRQDRQPEMLERRRSGNAEREPPKPSAPKSPWGQTWLHLEENEAGEALQGYQRPNRGALRLQTALPIQGISPQQPSAAFAYGSPHVHAGASPSMTDAADPRSAVANASDLNWTFRSFGTGPSFNQSEASRQPMNAHDPSGGQVNRISELSSLSSGFGDVDIVVPDLGGLQPPPAVWRLPPQLSQKDGDRLSWASRRASRRSSKVNSQRETVCTEASEDLPTRYRTVHSWVNQQTSRVKRAQARLKNGVPAENNGLPLEPRFSLMMPDGEVPRRPASHLTRM